MRARTGAYPRKSGSGPSWWSPAERRAPKDRGRREESRTAVAGRLRPVLGKSVFHTLKRRRTPDPRSQSGLLRFAPPSCFDIACRHHKNDGFYTTLPWLRSMAASVGIHEFPFSSGLPDPVVADLRPRPASILLAASIKAMVSTRRCHGFGA